MKKVIRLTESQFYNLIEDTIKKVMEGEEDDTISIDEEKITFDGDEGFLIKATYCRKYLGWKLKRGHI